MRLILAFGLMALLGGCSATSVFDRVSAGNVAGLRLLDCHKLPADAHNVWLDENNWLDADQSIRLDTSLANARALARDVLGQPAAPGLDDLTGHDDPLWWPHSFPTDAEGGIDHRVDDRPLVEVALVPHGDQATIWIFEAEGPSWRAKRCDVKRFPFA